MLLLCIYYAHSGGAKLGADQKEKALVLKIFRGKKTVKKGRKNLSVYSRFFPTNNGNCQLNFKIIPVFLNEEHYESRPMRTGALGST